MKKYNLNVDFEFFHSELQLIQNFKPIQIDAENCLLFIDVLDDILTPPPPAKLYPNDPPPTGNKKF